MSAQPSQAPWWRSAAIYQIYPRSFADGTGDGIGDLAGVRARLPYLAELGVDAVWFNPWYLSPQADGGYDVTDYRVIDPLFGDPGRRRGADRRGARAGHPRGRGHRAEPHLLGEPLVPGRAGRRARLAGARAVLVPAGPRRATASCRRTTGSRHVRRPDLDPGHRAGRRARRVVPAPVRPGAAGLQLGNTRTCRRSSRTCCGSGSTAAPTASASTRRRCWSRTRRCRTRSARRTTRRSSTARRCTTIYRSWRAVADSYDGDRVLIGEIWLPDAARLARYLRPGRDAHRLQLPVPGLRLGGRTSCAR